MHQARTNKSCYQVVTGRRAESKKISVAPRVVALGGDHTTTLPALRAAFRHWGKMSVIHFDAHIGETEFPYPYHNDSDEIANIALT
jgi:arginase family enzyme